MTRSTTKTAVVVAACAVLGAGAGIAGSSAAPSSPQAANSAVRAGHVDGADRFDRGRSVHSQSVVLNKAGSAFETVTRDQGTFKSLTADRLTITEATKNVTYKDATLTIAADAKVLRNFKPAKLTDLLAADRVEVEQSPDGTVVFATDDQRVNDGDHADADADGRYSDGDRAAGAFRDGPGPR